MAHHGADLCLDGATIAAFVAGVLEPHQLERVDQHMSACAQCSALVSVAAGLSEHRTERVGHLAHGAEPVERAAPTWRGLLQQLEQVLLDEPAPSSALAARPRAGQGEPALLGQRFQRGEPIAQGAMGVVYGGRDLHTGQAVAIKRLKPELAAETPEVMARFMLEGQILRRLNHPNIVRLEAALRDGDERYIVMDYVGGGSLRELLRRQRVLPLGRALAIALELADALSRAHHLDILHRDVKPENVLLAEDGTPRLSDFGLARLADQSLTSSGAILGTVAYLSPEALWGRGTDARADIWALGVMLFEMLTGQHPFLGDSHGATVTSILQRPLPDLEQLVPEAPVALVDLLQRMLEREREQRIASMRQVGAELERILREIASGPAVKLGPVPSVPGLGSVRSSSTAPRRRLSDGLPAPATAFVGRHAELAELLALFSLPETRLVTVIGTGGMGKSRLALEAARIFSRELAALSEAEAHELARGRNVCLVDLSSLGSAELLVPALADAVGFRFYAGVEPRRQLAGFFREKRLLLVLDNFENVVSGAGLLAELLEAAPGLRLLVTSRERLGLQAETQFVLHGLPVPDVADGDPSESGAAELFVQTARRVSRHFEVAAHERSDLVRICQLVQGMPLGIVLAASWAGTLSIAEIAREISSGLDFLSTDSYDVPARQRSLRAVFEHSVSLLSAAARESFEQVSVFRGGFTRAAAEAVAQASLRSLSELLHKSLLTRDPRTGRYEMHEMLRQYAESGLCEKPCAAATLRRRHALYYAEFLETRRAQLRGVEQRQALRDIDADIGNVRSAWQHLLDTEELSAVARSIDALGAYYQRRSVAEAQRAFQAVAEAFGARTANEAEARRVVGLALALQASFCAEQGMHADGRQQLERALSLLGDQHSSELAFALSTAAFSLRGMESTEQIVAHAERGLELYRSIDDRWGLARALVLYGRVSLHVLGDSTRAESQYREAIQIQRTLGDGSVVLPLSLAGLGQVKMLRGERAESLALIREGLAIAEDFGDPWSVFTCLNALALSERSAGNYVAAETAARRGLALSRAYGSGRAEVWGYMMLGDALKDQGRTEEAVAAYEHCLAHGASDSVVLASSHVELGNVALLRGQHEAARRHFEASLTGFESMGNRWGILLALDGLGRLSCTEGNDEAAVLSLTRALHIGQASRASALALQVVASLALWHARSGRDERAVELLGLVDGHPATEPATRAGRAEPLLAELRERLPPERFDAARARGRELDLFRIGPD